MNRRQGFTLIEVLSTMVMTGVLLGSLTAILMTTDTVYKRDSTMLHLQQQARNGMERMVRVLRESRGSMVTGVENGNDRITFVTIKMTGAKFFVENGALINEDPLGTKKLLASDISRLKFTRNGQKLKIDITARKEQDRGVFTFSLTEIVRLRNE